MNYSNNLMLKIPQFIKYRLILPLLRRTSILVLNYDMVEVGKRLDDLEKANKNLLNINADLQKSHVELQNKFNVFYKTFNLIMDDPKVEWLYKNRIERMDASVEVFDEIRRKFHYSRYEFACQYIAGKAVADIACGTGYGTDLLVNLGKASRAIGVDIDPDTIEYAKDKHMHEGIEFICASGDNTGIPSESVDVVISFETIEHVPDDIALLDEFRRILRSDGVLVCSTPNNWPADISAHHYRTYDRKKIETILLKFFQNIVFYNQNSGTSWEYNHEQPVGIFKTTAENEALAECYIAVCRKKAL